MSAQTAKYGVARGALKINSDADLLELTAGVIKDDLGDSLAQKAGITKIEGAANNLSNVKKLNSGRIDVWVYQDIVAQWQLKGMGFDPNDYEVLYTLEESPIFYAFNKDTDQALIDQLQKALDDLKADGTHQSIINNYLN